MIQCECAVIIILFKTFTLQSYHSDFGQRASTILHPGSLQQTEPILAVLHPMTYVYTWKIGLVWSFMETAKNHHDFGQKSGHYFLTEQILAKKMRQDLDTSCLKTPCKNFSFDHKDDFETYKFLVLMLSCLPLLSRLDNC